MSFWFFIEYNSDDAKNPDALYLDSSENWYLIV